MTSFVYNNQLYHIVTDDSKTYLAKIEKGEFVFIATISDKRLWCQGLEPIVAKNNHQITFFKNAKARGYIDIFENEINIVRCR
ncbi:MAG: hypothetical protein RL660_1465 [Bacteroidota bacterium]|jgi:hypothetical protein